MKYNKKFQNIGGTKGVIVPMVWIRGLEKKYPDKVIIGVHMDVDEDVDDEEIRLTPMWEGEK